MGHRGLKKPRYVHGYIDRHGKGRFYFRRPGFKLVPLPGLPWAPEFMTAYESAMAGQPLVEIGGKRTRPGSLRALTVSYFNSSNFRSLKPSTATVYRNIIERLCNEEGVTGIKVGDMPSAQLQRPHIVKLMGKRKPTAANRLRKLLRLLMQHAIEEGIRKDDPTLGLKPIKVKSDGFHSWNDAEIEQFQKVHPSGSKARLALALLLFTGQRRGDVVRMGRQHIRDGFLHVQQEKTGVELDIPIMPELQVVIDETPRRNMTFLITARGTPHSAAGFGNWFREQCDAAGLRHCSAHGLRKAAARRFAEFGCTVHEIAAITGHASLSEVQRYTKAADQKRLATAAVAKAKDRTSIG